MRHMIWIEVGMCVGLVGCVGAERELQDEDVMHTEPDEPVPVSPAELMEPDEAPDVMPGGSEFTVTSDAISYRGDVRGFPLPTHAHSFQHIALTEGRACVLDEHAQLLCFDVSPEGVAAGDVVRPIAQGVEVFALSGRYACVGHQERVSCLDEQGHWRHVLTTSEPVARLSMQHGNDLRVCATDVQGEHRCAMLHPYSAREIAVMDETLDLHVAQFAGFDLRDRRSGRLDTMCGVTRGGELLCTADNLSGDVNFGRQEEPRYSHRIPYVHARNSGSSLSARTGDGSVRVWQVNFLASEGEGLTLIDELEGSFIELYSESCGLRDDGEVRCWSIQPGCRGAQGFLTSWTLLERPQDVSVWEGSWCAVNEVGEVICGEALF